MSLIVADSLVKEFSRPVRVQGAFSGVRNLFTTKTVTNRAVDGVSLSIEPGEIVGYLGPNGAGKSTTIKMLTGVLVPTSGEVRVNGVVPWKDRSANARTIGAVFGQRTQLWFDLPLRDSFDVLAKLYGVAPSAYRRTLDEFVDLLDLGSFIDRPVRTLSLGQRMRGDLVAAMLHEPPVLYLDEPTVGLDGVAKARIREFVRERNRTAGTTVMLTTHDIGDVEQLCRRVVIIDDGRILFDGDIDALRRAYLPHRTLRVELSGPEPRDWWVEGVERAGTHEHGDVHLLDLRYDPTEVSTSTAIARTTAALPIADLTVHEPELEDVITEIYTARSVRRVG
ncbi:MULTISPECIES: ATP-binding cassette domain-containing protein [unclassified Curtobacterium]|uniref:ABC transporter ATP-binding protein n=1 Tax=unclassified Curtobacterium TaxID=257496 RepID=UPI00104B259B|nr:MULTISPECIES: ATP-binding cassette domain-containing protein [unclassified Curtobacterium]TCL78709.1 ABC-2 type transport system ATP-binding protein [Curtobacterium sp. PhB128]TCL95470.1 ABC-2 type transport system ATP-binding protein [Curtobacterium sp. PhB138]